MKDINNSWISEYVKNDCEIKKLEDIKDGLELCSDAYMKVFNGAPFYESWDFASSYKQVSGYQKDGALILGTNFASSIIGFLVAINGIPEDQRMFVPYDNSMILYIEEIGVVENYRNQQIASEMVRILLKEYLKNNIRYLAYRTNAMRYFELQGGESFEAGVIRVQGEDKIKRQNGEPILIPDFSFSEKQAFINAYLQLMKHRPDLDVSHSSALFRNIFGSIDYCMLDNDYAFQQDPSLNGNDRIFPIIDLDNFSLKRRLK